MILQSNKDFGYYWGFLKGNYKKGVDYLRDILTNPKSGRDFAVNGFSDAVIFGPLLSGVSDINSDELYEILQNSPYFDLACTKWFDVALGGEHENLAGIAGDADFMSTLVESTDAMKLTILTPYIFQTFLNDAVSATAIMSSSAAMAAVSANASALNILVNSSSAMAIMANSAPILTNFYASSVILAALIGSSVAMAAIAASSVAITVTTQNSAVLAEILADPTAQVAYGNATDAAITKAICDFAGIPVQVNINSLMLNLGLLPSVALSPTAALAASNSTLAMNAASSDTDVLMFIASTQSLYQPIVASPIAAASFANSSLKTTASATTTAGARADVYSGTNYVISLQNSAADAERIEPCTSNQTGYIDVSGTAKTAIGHFFSNLTYGPVSGTNSNTGAFELLEIGHYTTWQQFQEYGYTWQNWQNLGLNWSQLQVYGQ